MNLSTVRATIALGVAGILVLLGIGWVIVLGPKLDGLSQTQDERIALGELNSTMRVQLKSLQKQVGDLPAARARAKGFSESFPSTASQPSFFNQVTAAAVAAGIRPSAVTTLSPGVPVLDAPPVPEALPDPETTDPSATPAPAVPAPAPELARQSVSVDVSGTYEQLSALVAGLETMKRAMLTSTVAITSNEEGITLTLSGTTFVASPLGAPPTGTL